MITVLLIWVLFVILFKFILDIEMEQYVKKICIYFNENNNFERPLNYKGSYGSFFTGKEYPELINFEIYSMK